MEAAIKAGAPKDCIQWIEIPSIEATKQLMNHKDIALVLATGGSGMVKSAYSTGKPALESVQVMFLLILKNCTYQTCC